MSVDLTIRDAVPADVGLLHALIVELAVYEREPDGVTGTPEMLEAALFEAPAAAEALIAELAGVPVGFALFHGTFSTWECNRGLWLEDLYVRPQQRRAGVGDALVGHLAAIAVARGCSRLEWAALEWNEPALRFYAKLGAEPLERWLMHRLDGGELHRVAGARTPAGAPTRNRRAPPERGSSVAGL